MTTELSKVTILEKFIYESHNSSTVGGGNLKGAIDFAGKRFAFTFETYWADDGNDIVYIDDFQPEQSNDWLIWTNYRRFQDALHNYFWHVMVPNDGDDFPDDNWLDVHGFEVSKDPHEVEGFVSKEIEIWFTGEAAT